MMFLQGSSKINVGGFRQSRKCFSFSGCLIFVFIFVFGMAQQSTAKPHQDENLPPQPFDVSDNFREVDNLEIHRVKVVDGVSEEDHPIIIYKEDFVTEDFVPPRNETKSEKHKRRYKDTPHRRRHNKQNFTDVIEEKPEKILFDVLLEKPLIVSEEMEKPKISHMKLVPLIQDFSEINETNDEGSSLKKEDLLKRPKKFHHRVRRNANGEHVVRKRNPYFRHIPKIAGETPTQIQYIYVKHSVAGKKHNGLDIPVPGPRPLPTTGPNANMPTSFDNRIAADENDRVIFSSGRRTTPRPTQMPESIFRDPRPENFDFSFMNPQRSASSTIGTPIFNRQPQTNRPEESIFRDPRPENFNFSFMNPQAQPSSVNAARTPAVTSGPQPSTQAGISQCVWAIVNCCSNRNSDIRYSCFEQNGCYGAFWGLNPCADNVRDNFVNFVADYYN